MKPHHCILRNAVAIGVALVLLTVFCSAAVACPNCGKGIAEQSDGGDLVSGFQWSILFMMSMPFTILSFFGGYFYLEVRRARARQREAEQPSDDDEPASVS
ncbi:MAG: hypothetical protein IIB78_04465 [Proteobacteria bacterium]|nr:hypothetical protein [Pseudomonadota bacterium]